MTDFTRSLAWLSNLILDEKPDALILAGDIFDTHKPSTDENLAVLEFLRRVQTEMEVPVFAISGNHDIFQSGTGAPATSILKMTGIECAEIPRSVSCVLGNRKVRFDFLPYPSRGMLLASESVGSLRREEVDAKVNALLFDIVQGFTVEHKSDEIRVLIGHGSVSTAMVNEQPRSLAHDIQLPIKDCASNYHYVALGHIHQMQQVEKNAWYSGSLLRQGFGEEREGKGVLVVELDEGQAFVRFIENPHSRVYQTLTLPQLNGFQGSIDAVYRVKDLVTAEGLVEFQNDITALQSRLPFFQVSIEIERKDRQRDSEMTSALTPDQAVERALAREGIEDPLLGKVLTSHQSLMEELR